MTDTRDHDELEILRRCGAARLRLEERAGFSAGPVVHFRRPVERPFTAEERDRVTILFGGLTARHDRLIQAVLQSCGHSCQALPQPDLPACLVGKEYCDNSICNPAYFTIGGLIRFLQQLEAAGLSRREILDRYVFFTAGSCGPCRFGMYEAQFRVALRNAGFDGFRVLTFQQEHGIRAQTGEPGLKLTLHFALGAFDAFTFGDALQGFGYGVRPYEVVPGTTDRRLSEATEIVNALLAARRPWRIADRLPARLRPPLDRRRTLSGTLDLILGLREHLRGPDTRAAILACRERFAGIELDRLRVKPVVKVTGEFWAQTTEGDGSFRMFSFLENEGAHALVEPLGGWVTYLLQYARDRVLRDRGLDEDDRASAWGRTQSRWRRQMRARRNLALVELAERVFRGAHEQLRREFGGAGQPLADQRVLARLAEPYYRALARGGEGHLEVAKNLYYTTHRSAHMVLSLKPFGCMPSTQSDGVQSALVARFKDMLFVPVETAADGELAAHSRVQIALVEARARAEAEFDRALASTGRRLEEIQDYVAEHPELRSALYHVPPQHGVAGQAAAFVLHVSRLMSRRSPLRWRRAATLAAPGEVAQ